VRFALRSCAGALTSGVAERLAQRRRSRLSAADRRATGTTHALREAAQDIRLALRVIRRQPAVSGLSIATLAAGIGASAAVFSLIDASLLRPVPLPGSDRLVTIQTTVTGQLGMSAHDDVRDWIAQARTLETIAALRAQTVNLTGLDVPAAVRGGFVLGDFFGMAGVRPAMGRALDDADAHPSAPAAVVINDAVWQRLFHGAPDVLGRVIQLNNVPFRVVGVMPPDFAFPYDGAEVWLPARFHTGTMSRGARTIVAFGRLRAGAGVEQAQAELDAIVANLADAHPATNRGRGVRVVPLHQWLTNDARSPLTALFGLVLVLLAAACANVASLQIGATSGRRAEIGVRLALGASHRRIVRQLLTEYLTLAVVAGLCAVIVARALVPIAVSAASGITAFGVFGLSRVSVDARVLLFALALTVIAGLASGIAPASYWARRSPVSSMGAGGRLAGERRLTRTRRLLVISQVALAAVLITTGGLVVRSYTAILGVDTGFDATGVWSLEYRLPSNKYSDPARQTAFHEEVAARIASIPGVRHGAVARGLPLSGNGDSIQVLSDRDAPGTTPRYVNLNTVSDDFLAAMGIPLLAGRPFDRDDRADVPMVVLVSQSLASLLWPGEDPIGRTLLAYGSTRRARVIGVVGDVRHYRLAEPPPPMVYARHVQNPGIFMTAVAKVEGDAADIGQQLASAVWQVDRDQPVWKIRSLASLVDAAGSGTRFLVAALLVFAMAAALLVASGLYGVVSQGVAERRREIGIRMALGATRRRVVGEVLRSGLVMTLAGLAIGLAASVLVGRAIKGLLYGTAPFDWPPHVAAAVMLGLIAATACYSPARRASRTDPVRALRD
jgi:putative ABC transport system permease protein